MNLANRYLNYAFTGMTSVILVLTFFKPLWFVEYEAFRIAILIGGGFLPVLYCRKLLTTSG